MAVNPRRPYWRLNAGGIAIFLVLTAWLICVCTIKVMIELSASGAVTWPPLVGLGMGLLGLIGIGWGRTHEFYDEHPCEQHDCERES